LAIALSLLTIQEHPKYTQWNSLSSVQPKCNLSVWRPPPAVLLVGQFQVEHHQSACNGPETLQNPGTQKAALTLQSWAPVVLMLCFFTSSLQTHR
jgi:hypothetical protein